MKYLNLEGLQTFYNKLKTKFALKSEIPTTLPANGGNSDTVDGKHASDFAPQTALDSKAQKILVDEQPPSGQTAQGFELFVEGGTLKVRRVV